MTSFYIFPRIKLIHFLNEALCQNINHLSPSRSPQSLSQDTCPWFAVDANGVLSESGAGLPLLDACAGSSSSHWPPWQLQEQVKGAC